MFSVNIAPETQAASATQLPAQQLDATPFEADHPNGGFIRDNLPVWYLNAPATLRHALHASQQNGLRSWHVLAPIRNRLISAQEFAAPLLLQAFSERFKLALDVEAFQLMTWRYDSAWNPAPLE
ncbi:Leucine rich repeat domain-containing protein [Pseudomonas cannabina]|uniref:Leucine rich repeat domain-containing protein n=1 Tax=Pseudomonas cannabina TaxID=86840 RepID=A0A0P9LG06_PSECA|nr:Leucine rich repeat domain-containing protein [Pseudomonas cannabina]RMN17060.1 Leucine rich repeat domain-containing protein [Pseudomonas cannabina]SDR23515.1 hypothetical protein SAMN05216597_2966 [Pseudomonas cannabina]